MILSHFHPPCNLCFNIPQVTHHRQYPDGTTLVSSYFESRGGKFPEVVFFGLQYILKRWLCGPVITAEKIAEAKELYKLHFGQDHFNEAGWTHILEVCTDTKFTGWTVLIGRP